MSWFTSWCSGLKISQVGLRMKLVKPEKQDSKSESKRVCLVFFFACVYMKLNVIIHLEKTLSAMLYVIIACLPMCLPGNKLTTIMRRIAVKFWITQLLFYFHRTSPNGAVDPLTFNLDVFGFKSHILLSSKCNEHKKSAASGG